MNESDFIEGREMMATIILNNEGSVVSVPTPNPDVIGYQKSAVLGMSMEDMLANPCIEHGKRFEQAMHGEFDGTEVEIKKSDGSEILVSLNLIPITHNGENCLNVDMEYLEDVENDESVDFDGGSFESDTFDEIDPEKLNEVVQNIRIDAAEGSTTLDAIMLDLAVGHNEL